jgi:hypothetical protein
MIRYKYCLLMRYIYILNFIEVVKFIDQSENVFEEFLSVLFFAVSDIRLTLKCRNEMLF